MNPVEQVISARQAEFQSAFEAAKQSATTFETKLNERLNETTTAKTTSVLTVTDAELTRAREAYEALINQSDTNSAASASSTTTETPLHQQVNQLTGTTTKSNQSVRKMKENIVI